MTATELRQEIDKVLPCGYLISPGSESWYLITLYNGHSVCVDWNLSNGYILSIEDNKPLNINISDEATLVSEIVRLLTKHNGSSGYIN